MPKNNRLNDTITFLRENKGKLHLSEQDIRLLEHRVEEHDRIGGGASLSLNWSWYESRPGKAARKSIRAYILISIYNGEIVAAGASGLADRLKTKGEDEINRDLSRKIKDFVAAPQIFTRAVEYTLGAAGGGKIRAVARGVLQDTTVPLTMGDVLLGRVAVMLIDMQDNVGGITTKSFDGEDQVQHMAEVLKVAGNLNMRVYEIVIDKDAALKGGKRGKVSTIQALKQHIPESPRCRFMPKPYFNSFQDTPLAAWLKEDKIKTVVVMGYDANLCVKNTIFGTPEDFEVLSGRKRTKSEVEEWRLETPNSELYKEHMIPLIEDKRLRGYLPGLLDKGYIVITSRAIAASGLMTLEEDYGPITGI